MLTDDMLFYVENCRVQTQKTEWINELSKVAGEKIINTQKSVALLYTNNEKDIKKIIPFIKALRRIILRNTFNQGCKQLVH